MKRAFIFPGQGAQYVGMGKDFYDSFLVAKETFQEADELLGYSLSKIIFEGPVELLTQTKHSQLAIFVTSIAILRTIQQQLPDLKPTVCAGLSLGEYTALCASGRLSFAETLMLVKERARLMNEACEKTSGTMAAVLGLDALGIEAAVKGLKDVWVANYNAPGQTVISGTKEGVEKATNTLKECGARRVIPLSVHGAFHSGLMDSAQQGLAPFVERAPVTASSVEFVMNVPGGFVKEIEEIRSNLICQVTQSVRWEQGIEAMKEAGIEHFVEIGCGKTLAGLNKKMGILSTFSVDKVADLELAHATT
ncbi:MAG: [acyl-carrier-protein] S-malonyltransferase [Chlamydiae bacterium CG10_big_fil_rev_8_21_14_0_10_42_34]|nr:MAG: [acyl-carrier-protein] S-malonyltransferase [Chlamydiae bacterium CG10_big_fil_rev_8_21_14_0_10_42_34]